MKKLRKRKIAKAMNLRLKTGTVYMRRLKSNSMYMAIYGEHERNIIFFSRTKRIDNRSFLDKLYAVSAENIVRKNEYDAMWSNEED